MSSKIKGLRRVGIVGLSTVVAASMMTLTAGTSFAVASTFALGTGSSITKVAQGQLGAPAGDLTLGFDNAWTTLAPQTFTVGANDCSTAALIGQAVEFSALPTATVSDPAPANVGARTPNSTLVLGSSTPACASAGITDLLTITQPLPSTGDPADRWVMDLTNIKYNIGATRAPGNISVVAAGFMGAGTVANANIATVNFTNSARVAALPSATGVSLGTQTFGEGTAGAIFPASTTTTVTLTLPVGLFTGGVTPTITAPTGYTVVRAATATTAVNTYSFTVAAPATAVKATVTVSGLTSDVAAAVGTRLLSAATTTPTLDLGSVKTINVLNYNARIGGATRYDTAAALFNARFGPAGVTESPNLVDVTSVVLSGGALFPDALSANYLAGKLGTGTLLTTPSALSNAARLAIINAKVSTVYITGGFGAVGQGVENTIEAMHVGNSPTAAFITTVRLGGATRYETNRLVNENNFTPSNTVILTSGGGFSLTEGFADALAMGPVAYTGDFAVAGAGYPLIITSGGPTATLGSNENTQLADFNPTNVIIAGGTGVVSAAIEASLKANGKTVLRLAGQNRTQTAAAIAGWATAGVGTATGINASRNFVTTTTHITTGTGFADALAAGPVAGSTGTVILLSSSPTVVGLGIPAYLGTLAVGGSGVTTLNALGLTGATSNALMKAAAATISVP